MKKPVKLYRYDSNKRLRVHELDDSCIPQIVETTPEGTLWRCRHGAFRGDGAFGQYCVVMPEQEAVLAITSGVGDMQAVLNHAWDHLLPAMKSGSGAKEEGALKKQLATLAVPPPDFPAKQMQRQPEFMQIVFQIRDMIESLESSTRAGDE